MTPLSCIHDRGLVRVKRFARSLLASLRFWADQRRRALAQPQHLGVVKALRRAWLVSDPDWMHKFRRRHGTDTELQE